MYININSWIYVYRYIWYSRFKRWHTRFPEEWLEALTTDSSYRCVNSFLTLFIVLVLILFWQWPLILAIIIWISFNGDVWWTKLMVLVLKICVEDTRSSLEVRTNNVPLTIKLHNICIVWIISSNRLCK